MRVLAKNSIKRSARLLVMNHHSARWRRRAKNRSDHKTGYPRVHLGRADFDLVREMLS